MANQHAAYASAVAVTAATETLAVVSVPFNYNAPPGAGDQGLFTPTQPNLGPEGVAISGSLNVTATATGTTLYTVKIYRGASASGTLLQTTTLTAVSAAGQVTALDIGYLDSAPTNPTQYAVTITTNAGAATVNAALLQVQDATSFE